MSDRSPSRRRWRFVERLAIGVAIAATLIFGVRWVLHTSYFRVQRVEIVGLTHESRASALAITGLTAHPAMIDLNDGAIASEIEQLSWVQSATVQQRWPHTVVITVTPRTPVGVAYGANGALWLVSAQGTQLSVVTKDTAYPLLEAVGSKPQWRWPYATWAAPAAAVAAQLPAAFSSQVSVVSVNRSDVVDLELTTPITLTLGPPTQLHAKFVAAAAVLARADLLHAGDRVDLTVPSSPVVSGP